MYKYEVPSSAIVQDFNRRGLAPDWQHKVEQGILRLWRINNNLMAELYIGSDNGKPIPGTIKITTKYMYLNTLSPQEIADDLMVENKLGEKELDMVSSLETNEEWFTTVDIENKYKLAKGSVRRDIHRRKLKDTDLKKIGRDWIINKASADKLYNKNINTKGE